MFKIQDRIGAGVSDNAALDNDPFGLFFQDKEEERQQSCSARHEFIYQSAIDRLDDIFQIKRNASDHSVWLGLVLPVDELRVCGKI